MIELKNAQFWQKSVDAISSFISEGNFRFNEKGMSFKAVDPSQVVLVDYFIDKSAFDVYDVEPTFIGVDLVELSRVMGRAMPKDKLQMEITDSEILVRLEGDLTRSFKLPLIDVSESDIKLPEHRYDAVVTIPSRIFKEALKDAGLFSSSVVLRVKGNQFMVEARGSQGTLNTVSKQTKGITVKAAKEVVAKYSLNFLMNLVKEADAEQEITLELRSDAPMRVSYKIGNSQIQFYLAHMLL